MEKQMQELTPFELGVMWESAQQLLRVLRKERRVWALWTGLAVATMVVNVGAVWHWAVESDWPVWARAGMAAVNVMSVGYLGHSVYRYWRQWYVAWQAVTMAIAAIESLTRKWER